MAHADLIYPGFLEGGEPVAIIHMHPHDRLKFAVPAVKYVLASSLPMIQRGLNSIWKH